MMNTAVHFHSKWFEIVQHIFILSIFIPNGLKQYNPFLFHFHSKCIVNKYSFYLFHQFLPFRMVKTILTKHSFYPFHPFLPFRMIKTILIIPNGNSQNDQKWRFQTGPIMIQERFNPDGRFNDMEVGNLGEEGYRGRRFGWWRLWKNEI